ncbi:MAG: alpha/beta hydrolase [Cyanobacteria bacterium]|nr:alpha/beta hydrolase [Cyanobacteriota bacterium]
MTGSRHRLRKLLIGEFTWWRLARSLAFIYGFFALYVFFRADSMIFLPPPPSYGESAALLKVPVTTDEQIAARYLPNPEATHTLLVIHGNAEDLGDLQSFLDRLHSWGFSVFAYDYRGYGISDGTPSERHAYQDAEAAYRYLTETLKISPAQILVYGRSVGGGSATALAATYPVGGLILQSTFTSVFRVVVPFPLLPFDKFPNRRRIRQVTVPVLVMHGQADTTIPWHHGQALYDAAPGPKAFLWVPGADHNNFEQVAGDRLPQALQAFQALVQQSSPSPKD